MRFSGRIMECISFADGKVLLAENEYSVSSP